MKQETAVDWLVEELNKETGITSFVADCDDEYKSTILSIIQQANEMFEQQIIDAIIFFKERPHLEINAEQYYNETFKQQEK
jgi:hypothetical protein